MAHASSSCPSCSASLEPDVVCLAGLRDEALVAEPEDSHFGEGAESAFGDFSRPAAGMFGK
jgi:hypothetical protein